MKPGERPGRDAVQAKGWLLAHKWLLLRRVSQLAVLVLFLLGPWAGIWIVKGTLASSLTLDILPLTDPYMLVQSMAAGHAVASTALIGAGIVVALYLVVGGRTYCSWVCPINPVTDLSHWLAVRLGLRKGWQPDRSTRYWLMGATVVVSAIAGVIAWELINPITMVHRGLAFGMGFAWAVVAAVFLFDLLVSRRGWCGRLCPVGAFYGLLGQVSAIRVQTQRRDACNDCMDCFAICPEPQVIKPALKGAARGVLPVILERDCTNCGRCIDVCSKDVFEFGTRFPDSPTDRKRSGIPRHREAA